MDKHTPGPWLMEWKRGNRVFVEYEAGDELDRELIARVSGPEANARLIAAAPELLEIAKAYRNLLRTAARSDGEVQTFHHIESVIAKAEGLKS